MAKHKHAELIKAWAEGAEIEVRGEVGEPWMLAPFPAWIEDFEYRIKPTAKPDRVYIQRHYYDEDTVWHIDGGISGDQLVQWTIDGETGRIKSVELLDK